MTREGTNLRQWMLGAIANIAGDCVESGQFHLARGWLNPVGQGLLLIYDTAADELVSMGAVDAESASRQKTRLRKNAADVG